MSQNHGHYQKAAAEALTKTVGEYATQARQARKPGRAL
jgi:hypothetical protein